MGRSRPFTAGDAIAPCAMRNTYIVGRDVDGRWVVRDDRGTCGGLFADEEAAVRFAAFESGHRAGAVRRAPRDGALSLMGPISGL